jgi:flagellar basal body-associated protein FliL
MSSEFDALVSRWEPRSLLRPAGKFALKDALAEHLNLQLRTAVVRRIYITDFAMSPGR